MSGWLEYFNYFMSGAAILMTALGLWFILIMPGIDRWSRHFFRGFFVVIMLASFFNLVETILLRYPEHIAAEIIILYIESLVVSLPMPMLTVYLLHCCGRKPRGDPLFLLVTSLWAIYFVMLTATHSSEFFYYVGPDLAFYTTPYYPLIVLPLTLIMFLNLLCAQSWRRQMSRKYYISFLVAVLPLTLTMLVHMFTNIFPLIDICIALSVLSMFSLILSDQIAQNLRQQREIAQQRASIMVLQMRPHFIYNTMTSIYYLCDQDPEMAKRVTLNFNTYLQRNFNAIASEELIPFSKELEHTRAYLAVEQAQFEGRLFVDYDTPYTRFSLPPLTLQPIVENAVKHGMDPDAEPLRITLRQRDHRRGQRLRL